jgi:D(-)-tartrate dehydratase
MKILAVHETTVPIGAAMGNASIRFDAMTASALAIVSDRRIDGKPVIGYAFDSIGRYGSGALLKSRFLPRLLAAAPDALLDARGLIDPDRCYRLVMANEKGGGHGERSVAVGLLDAALWDLRAKLEEKPLWRALADRYHRRDASDRITVYGACGHFRDGEGPADLGAEVRRAVDAGFTRVKIKLGGTRTADDCARIEAAAQAMGGSDQLAVDLNGGLEPDIVADWLDHVAPFKLAWIEEPVDPLDYSLLASFIKHCPTPVATGENLFSWDDARNLLRYGGIRGDRDIIQVDVSLSYGICEYLRVVGGFEAAGWSRKRFWPHAGHLFAAQVVAGLAIGGHEAAVDANLPYGGFWDGTNIIDGQVTMPALPGVGFEGKANFYKLLAPLGARA